VPESGCGDRQCGRAYSDGAQERGEKAANHSGN
jgi:hypothetical protein